MAEWRQRAYTNVNGKGGPGRRPGSIDGYTQTELKKQRKKAKEEAVLIMEQLAKKFELPKEEFAREALQTSVEIMRTEALSAKDKLAAARTVLEYTMAKPASQNEVTVKRAEDFLSDIASEIGLK